jgi:DNA-binding NarL/FixJ family response regulator
MPRIVLYTDREIFGAGLRHALPLTHCLEIVHLRQVLPLLDKGSLSELSSDDEPDVLLLDAPPEQSGDMLRMARSHRPGMPVIVWERVSSTEPALSALGLGAQGVILDSTSSADVLVCIETVLSGKIWVPPSIAQAVVASRSCHLTRREGQLVHLVSHGLSNKEIATSLGISVGTVKVYFSRLFDKLEVSDRYELAMLGLRQAGTIGPGSIGAGNHSMVNYRPGAFPQTVFLPRLHDRPGERAVRV